MIGIKMVKLLVKSSFLLGFVREKQRRIHTLRYANEAICHNHVIHFLKFKSLFVVLHYRQIKKIYSF